MRTILVDDELWMLEMFEDECASIPDIQLEGKFDNPIEALDFAKANKVELAFLDVDMPVMTGLELAEKLKTLYPEMIIIFVSGYEQYMAAAFRSRNADYYVLKPYKREDVQSAIDRAKLLSGRLEKPVHIQTFGRFVVSVGTEELKFGSSKAKEMLAFLVDKRDESVSSEDIYSALWEDRPFKRPESNVFYNVINRLRSVLEEYGISQILITLPKEFKLNTKLFDCDYYNFLDGDTEAIKRFDGEYMSNYSWAEETNARLTMRKEKLMPGGMFFF